jgi:hypothetical protein
MDEGALRDLLAERPLGALPQGRPAIYAVDTSAWPRCDAECSPERGYYYHPSRHSAGQPIVAGWAYQFVAGLGFGRDSWVVPVDARRVRPEEDANEVAVAQLRELVGRLPRHPEAPLFVFDAGYDSVRLQRNLRGCRVQLLVRLHSGRVFYADPPAPERRPVGRPFRHGDKLDCKDPSTWPEPDHEHLCETADCGAVHVRAWRRLHPKTRKTLWVIERTNSWHNAHEKFLWCTERRGRVADFWVALSGVIVIVRRLVREGWTRYRWDGRPSQRL